MGADKKITFKRTHEKLAPERELFLVCMLKIMTLWCARQPQIQVPFMVDLVKDNRIPTAKETMILLCIVACNRNSDIFSTDETKQENAWIQLAIAIALCTLN